MGRGISKELMTHCRREVFHAQWAILLDDEFIEAYTHGIVVMCCDGILRRFYPRILTYSADYPEKYVVLVPVVMFSITQLYIMQSSSFQHSQQRTMSLPKMLHL